MNRRRFAGAWLLAALGWTAAHAAPTTCTISTSGLDFGSYDPTSAMAATANGSIGFMCTYKEKGFTATVTISPGISGSYANRTLTLATQSLNYNIYINAADTEIFGDGSGSRGYTTYVYSLCYPGRSVSCPGGGGQSGIQYNAPMYGLLPAQQDVSAGLYTDRIIATITY